MPRWAWTLSVGTLLLLGAGVAWTQDRTPFADFPGQARKAPEYFSRTGRTGSSEEPSTAPRRYTRQHGAAQQVIPASASEEAEAPRRIRHELFRPDAQPEAKQAKNEADAPPESESKPASVVNAGFQREDGKSERDSIRMIGARSAPADETGPSRVTITRGPIPAPTGKLGPQRPSLTLEWLKQSDVNVGQECAIDLVVRNEGEVAARDVVVEAFFPATVRLTSAAPRGEEAVDRLAWSFDSLAPGDAKTINLELVPSERGALVTTAQVRFTGSAAGSFEVKEPLLEVALTGPEEVMIGDPASQIVTISNPGTGVARNVVVEADVPPGLEHVQGKKLVTDVGALNPGESRQVRLALVAAAGGGHPLKVTASGTGNLQAVATATVSVAAPSVSVAVDGPGRRFLGRPADYVISVNNDGAVVSNNVRVRHQVPDGFRFVDASRGGKFDASTKTINWFVGRMKPGESLELVARLEAASQGEFNHRVGSISEHGARDESQLTTRVEGAASLVLEIVDQDDPVEIAQTTMYEIRVGNTGTAAASDVGISCELPSGVAFVDAKGPTSHIAENGVVVFKSLPALKPGKTALFRVMVRGASEGNHRFRTRLASDSITEPLIVEELTRFYRD